VAATPERTATTDRPRWLPVAGLGLALFMATLDMTIVATTLPVIGRDLHAPPQHMQWVMLAYLLPTVALAIPAGRWIDQAGPRAAFLFTVLGFGASSALVAAAPTLWAIVAARAVQGAFAGLIGPVVLAGVAAAVLAAHRGRALGLMAALAPLGAVLGPGAGGMLAGTLGWRAVFLVNLPVCLVSAWIGRRELPWRSFHGRRLPLPDGRLLREALLLGVSVIALLLTLDRLSGTRFDPIVVALPVVAILAFSAWRRLPGSRRVTELVLDRALAPPLAALLFLVAGTNLLYFLIPYFLQDVGQHRPAITGAVLLALPASMAATSLLVNVLAGTVADRLGPRRMALGGAMVVIAGEVLLLPLNADARPASVAWRLAVIGGGKGLFMGPNQTAILAGTPRDATATVGGVSALARWLGFALGPALGALCWTVSDGGMPAVRAGLVAALAVTTIAAACCLAISGRTTMPIAREAGAAGVSERPGHEDPGTRRV
jgi:DHA2 family multidrug resistance protein-like MFS transporter